MTSFRCPLAVAIIVVGTGFASAQANVKKLSDVAKELKEFLDGKGEAAINQGAITGPDNTRNAGPGFAERLRAELTKLKIEVRTSGANHTIKGEYSLGEVKPSKDEKPLSTVHLEFKIVDKRGKTLTKVEQDILDETAVLEAFGVTAELPATKNAAPNPERDRVIREQILDQPKPPIDAGKATSSAKGTFAVEILVGGQQRPVADQDGVAQVALKRGEEYVVRLVNGHPQLDMAVNLAIDGINVFEFSDVRHPTDKTRPKFSVYIVPPGKSVDILGWHKDMETAHKFEVSGYADSAAAKLAKTADAATMGVITATFAAAWPKDQPPPADETASTKSLDGDATKLGAPTKFVNKEVERVIGTVRGSVSVRYSKPAQ